MKCGSHFHCASKMKYKVKGQCQYDLKMFGIYISGLTICTVTSIFYSSTGSDGRAGPVKSKA